MKRKNYYKLSPERKNEVLKYGMKRKWTWNDLYKHYKQPSWCTYPEALSGEMGCWTLISMSGVDSRGMGKDKCITCDCSKYNL